MTILEQNMRLLEKCDDELYQAVLNYHGCGDVQIKTERARDQTAILKIQKDTQTFYMNSRYNPIQESEIFAQQYHDVIDYSSLILLGFGNGIFPEAIIRYLGDHVRYLFYEPSAAIFVHVLERYDLSDILINGNVRIVVKGLNESSLHMRMAEIINNTNYKLAILDALPKYKSVFPKEYEEMKQKYCYLVEMVRINVNTNADFGRDIAQNNIYNMRWLLNGSCEEDLEGILPVDMPAIIVAAGPSLEKNVGVLKRIKGKALIIAVDTALRYLVSEGIFPDVAVSADPRKPVQLFENKELKKIPLAVASSLNYKVVEKMSEGKIIFMSSECAYYNELFGIVGKKMYSLASGGSVSTSAFSLAIAWGFRRLVLVGQDLALSADKVHAGQDDIDTFKLKEKKIPVEGYYGDTVYTSPDYKAYLDWYNLVIPADEELEVINATEGGARIKGTRQMTLMQVAEEYCQKEYDFESAIRNVTPVFTLNDKGKLLEYWNKSIQNLKDMKQNMQMAEDMIRQSQSYIKEEQYSEKQVANLHQQIQKIVSECANADESFFVDRIIADRFEDVLGDIYAAKNNDKDEYCRLMDKMWEYLNAMKDAIDEVIDMFHEVVRDVEQTSF